MTSWFLALTAMISVGLGCAPSAAAAFPDHTGTIYDWLIMKVCVDQAGNIVAQDPLHCPEKQQRNLRPGEAVPYFHADFLPKHAQSRCRDVGFSRRYAFPLPAPGRDETGAEFPLIVGWNNEQSPPDSCSWNVPGPADTMTVLTVQQGWGAIVGARFPKGHYLALGEGYLDPTRHGISRFNKTWGFPEQIPPEGGGGYVILMKKQDTFKGDIGALSKFPEHDPNYPLAQTLEFWKRLEFAYGSATQASATLDTMVEIGFSKSASTRDAPGQTRGSEHLYLSKELGYTTRWELWKREDQKNARELAQKEYAKQTCSAPANVEGNMSPHFILDPIAFDSAGKFYKQRATVIDETGARESHDWYLTGCHDFTNVQAQTPFTPGQVVTEDVIGKTLMDQFRTNVPASR